eukprot:1816-Heterococcus_DN1.PRE.3
MNRFQGKVTIVTGASSGIGLAAAQQLAKEGAKVIMVARTQSKLDAAVKDIKAKDGEAYGIAADVGKDSDNKRIVDETVEKYGRLDVSFINAGMPSKATFSEVALTYTLHFCDSSNCSNAVACRTDRCERFLCMQITEEMLDSVLATNVKSVAFAFKYQLPAIEKSGGKGSVLVTSSCAGMRASGSSKLRSGAVYAASKAAANMLTQYAFQGKVAIITGASSGIGLAAAQQLAKEGAKVVMVARTQSKLDAAVKSIKAQGGEALGLVADVSKNADNKRIVDETMSKYGRLDVSFINAGTGERVDIIEFSEEALDRVLATNTKSVAFAFKYQLPAIEKSGGKGSIVVNTSCAGTRGSANPAICRENAVYAASKAAANMLAQYAAVKAAEHGTRVNAVAPGVTRTDAMAGMTDDAVKDFAVQLQLIPRAAAPEEVAKFVCFLLSDDASFITGSIEAIDGGALLKM